MMHKQPYAEDIKNYWKSGKSAPHTWIEKAEKEIDKAKGKLLASGRMNMGGQAAYVLAFEIAEDQFKVIWPILQSRTRNDLAAQRQAATMLYHDVKAKCMAARVFGARKAFFPYLVLTDGRVASDVAVPELELEINQYLRLPVSVQDDL